MGKKKEIRQRKSRRKKLRRYPWDKWLGYKQLTLVKGRHFDCRPYSMGVQVRTAAAKRGIKVSIKIHGSVLTITILQ